MANDTLIAIGEALIDFIPDKKGCEFYEVTGFTPTVGGAPANVCGAFSKLGGKSKMITQLGNDPFGDKITRYLKDTGIDTSCISYTDNANTALAFVSLKNDGNRTFSFYRKPSADMLLSKDTLKKEWFQDCYAFHFCSVSLGDFPMRDAHERAIEYAKSNDALISFDPNLRFKLWEDKEALRETVRKFIPLADILKISDEELEFITGETDIEKALQTLFCGNVKLVLYTLGSNGAYAFTPSKKLFSPSYKVNAADTTGAGDGFIGSFLWKLKEKGIDATCISDINEIILKEALDFANKFCAISVQYPGAIDSYPGHETINQNL
ncbi:MAG: carbohydrate kinase [Oscillospiraceae bacterium]|nr:carbohydrate kinase [Oscillospiraceae bacterium]